MQAVTSAKAVVDGPLGVGRRHEDTVHPVRVQVRSRRQGQFGFPPAVARPPQRLHLRIVDRGRALDDEVKRIFATQSRLFLDFRYSSQIENVNVTEFAFAYAGSGAFVS